MSTSQDVLDAPQVCIVEVWPGGNGLPARICGHPIDESDVLHGHHRSDGAWPTNTAGEWFCNGCAPPMLPDDLVDAGALDSESAYKRLVWDPARHEPVPPEGGPETGGAA